MGNFSRDSFKETNMLASLLGVAAPVADPKQYVGVRLQQGVPILDADWNELEDLRRLEMMALIRFFIGNGVPAGTQGFKIVASPNPNTFTIEEGVILLEGHFVINHALTNYTAQPNGAGLPPLNTPGGDRTDLVYLDSWEQEADAAQDDPRLINNLIGIETSVRIERKWVVRVQEDENNLADVPKEPGHKYTALALLRRLGGLATITSPMIVDQRKTGITLAENLKIPMFIEIGVNKVDSVRFAEMLKVLRTALFGRLKLDLLPHEASSVARENMVLLALQDLMNRSQSGEVQAAARNFNNDDALNFLKSLYDAQKAFLAVLLDLGNVGGKAAPFVTEYTKYLDGDAGEFIKGLKISLDNNDLLGAVIAQEALNKFLADPVNVSVEGSVDVLYTTVNPLLPLADGTPFTFSFDIVSHVSSPDPSEEFEILVSLSAGSWQVNVSKTTVVLTTEGKETITVTVTPDDGLGELEGTLLVKARAKRNQTIDSKQPGVNLKIGVVPPVGNFFFYADPAGFDLQNRVPIKQSHLTRAQGRKLLYKLRNDNATEVRTYQVVHSITPVGDTTGWSPLLATPTINNVQVNPNTTQNQELRVDGPKDPAPAPAIGTTGELLATATLTAIDGNPFAGPSTEVRLNFVVVA